MNLYTFIINFRSGTFISQISSEEDIEKSIINWWEKFKIENKENINEREIKEIYKRLFSEDYKPIRLDNIKGVWCNDLGFIGKEYFSMNIIKHTN